jgi:hypothetical protein
MCLTSVVYHTILQEAPVRDGAEQETINAPAKSDLFQVILKSIGKIWLNGT